MSPALVLVAYAVIGLALWGIAAVWGAVGVWVAIGVLLAVHIGYRLAAGEWMKPMD